MLEYQNSKNHKKNLKKLEDNQKELEKKQEQTKDELQNFALNPLGALQGKVTGLLNKFIPLAIITTIVDQVHARILKEFGPGGRFDIRKMVQDFVLEFIPIELVIARDRGEEFFGSAQNLTQGAPEFSNTERLQEGRVRDLQRNMGY